MKQLRTPDENEVDAVEFFMLMSLDIGINRSADSLGSAIS
jgi:hypothetical protein